MGYLAVERSTSCKKLVVELKPKKSERSESGKFWTGDLTGCDCGGTEEMNYHGDKLRQLAETLVHVSEE